MAHRLQLDFKNPFGQMILIALLIGVSSYPQIDNDFKPVNKSFDLGGPESASLLRLEHLQPLRVEVDINTPAGQGRVTHVTTFINENKVSEVALTGKEKTRRVNFFVPKNFLKIGDNRVALTVSPENSGGFRLKVFNFLGSSPNIPIAFVVLDGHDRDSYVGGGFAGEGQRFALAFLLAGAACLLYGSLLSLALYDRFSVGFSACIKFFWVAALVPLATLLYSWATPYHVLFPYETVFWITLLPLLILQIFFGWLLGSFSPAAANFFFPQNNRGNRFLKHAAQKSFAVAENFIRMIGARLFWFFLFGFFILFHSPGNLRFFLYAFSFTALLFFHGIGLTIFICPKKLQPYTLILSPLVGYCFLILMGWYFYNYWPGGTETYANYLLAAPLVLMTAAGVWLANRKETRQTYFDKELLTPLAIGVVIFLFQSIPFLVLENSLTSLSWGNNDIPDSTSVSTYLKSYAKNASDGFLGQASVLQYLASQAVFGGSFSVALASTLFSLETYQLQSLSLHVLFLLSIPLVYILARESFRYNAPGSTLIAALYGLNPIMWWVVYQGYQGQVFATTVTLGLLLLHIHTIQNCRKMSEFIPYIPLAVLFHWGISLTYPHMFPIVFSPLLGYLFFLGFFKKSVAWHWTVFFLVTLLLMALLSFQRAEAILAYFLKMGQFDFGLFIPWIAPHEFFGLWKMDLPGVAPFLISFLMAGIILVGLRNLYRENREVFYLSAASILVVFSGYLLLCFMGQTEEGLGGYKSFKLLSFFLPLILAATLVFFRGITFAAKSFTAVFLVVFLIGGNIGSTFYLAQQMVRNNIVVDSDLADLKKIQDNPRVHSINLLGMEAWSVLWQVNFLISKKLFFGINTYGGRTQSDLDGEWDLLPSNPEALHIAGFDDRETLDLNPTYILKKAGKPKNLKGHLGFGWEKSNSPYMTMQYHTAGIQLYSPGEAFPIDLQAEFIAPAPDCRLAVFLNNKKVGSCGDSQSCRLNHIKLSRWTHYLDFRTEPSCSGYRFTHLKFSPQQP